MREVYIMRNPKKLMQLVAGLVVVLLLAACQSAVIYDDRVTRIVRGEADALQDESDGAITSFGFNTWDSYFSLVFRGKIISKTPITIEAFEEDEQGIEAPVGGFYLLEAEPSTIYRGDQAFTERPIRIFTRLDLDIDQEYVIFSTAYDEAYESHYGSFYHFGQENYSDCYLSGKDHAVLLENGYAVAHKGYEIEATTTSIDADIQKQYDQAMENVREYINYTDNVNGIWLDITLKLEEGELIKDSEALTIYQSFFTKDFSNPEKTAILAHELGHVFGLGDIDAYTEPLMYREFFPGVSGVLSPTKYDWNGANFVRHLPWYESPYVNGEYYRRLARSGNSFLLHTGWYQHDGAPTRYYFMRSDKPGHPLGSMLSTDWVLDGKWYYLDGSGVMVTGFYTVGGVTYYFREPGENPVGGMFTGWKYVGTNP